MFHPTLVGSRRGRGLRFGNWSTGLSLGSVVFTGFAPTIQVPRAVSPGVGAVTVSGSAPNGVNGSVVTPNAGAGTWTGVAPTVTGGAVGGEEPSPADAGATVHYDIRSSLQAVTNTTQLAALIQDLDSALIPAGQFGFYKDGANVVRMRYNWPTGGAGSTDVAFTGVVPWSGQNSGSVNFCVSWKERWGKMSGDTGANGTTDVLDYRTDYVNAHIKSMLILRGSSGKLNDRRIYAKCWPSDLDFEIDGNDYWSAGTGFSVLDGQGTDVKWTVRVHSSSADNTSQSSGPADGTLEVWRNGVKVLNRTGQRIGRGAPWGLNTMATVISTNGPTTAYQWDLVVWGIA